MRIGILSTRLAGTDGVSLETAKWVHVLQRMGHEVFTCAGELGPEWPTGTLVPAMHFRDPAAAAAGERAFSPGTPDAALEAELRGLAAPLRDAMGRFVEERRLEMLVVENVHAIPMHLPLGAAVAGLIADTGLPTLAHHHDFYWERERYLACRVPDFLDAYFPFDAPNVRHVVIHSGARRDLAERRGLASVVVPNVFDFAVDPPGFDAFNADFRRAIDVADDALLVLQPTRVVPRKGIELAIELVSRLDRPDAVLLITHEAGDEGVGYLDALRRRAAELVVDLRYAPEVVGTARATRPDGSRVYSLWDAYPHADLVTYPSLYEGFGNALIESVYFRRPVFVNRYPVYQTDIGPLGFDFVEIDGAVTDGAVAEVGTLLADPARRRDAVNRSFDVGREHFSYEVLEAKLRGLLESF